MGQRWSKGIQYLFQTSAPNHDVLIGEKDDTVEPGRQSDELEQLVLPRTCGNLPSPFWADWGQPTKILTGGKFG